MHTLLEIHKFIHHVHGLNAHVSIKSWIFMLKLKLLCTLRKIVCWLEKNTFMLVTKSDRTVCWESSFCLTLITFVIQFCQLLKIHIAVCNWLLERCNPMKHCRMLETRKTIFSRRKGLLLSLLFFLSVYSIADAQESRMNSGLFKKVILRSKWALFWLKKYLTNNLKHLLSFFWQQIHLCRLTHQFGRLNLKPAAFSSFFLILLKTIVLGGNWLLNLAVWKWQLHLLFDLNWKSYIVCLPLPHQGPERVVKQTVK